jgi:prophage DNA circulation protein
MSWRDSLKVTAKFRNVSFLIEAAELEGGRRGVKHEYPLRDVPFVEDLGRRARVFPIEAFVVGDDYITARDALIAALETPGAGELVHPHYGVRRVICTTFRIRESSDAGGMARFGITFEETESAPQFPTSMPAAPQALTASADAASVAIESDFEAAYLVDGQPALALESLQSVVQSAADAMDDAFTPLMAAEQDLASLKRGISDLTANLDALVRAPLDVVSSVSGILESLTSLAVTPRQAITALLAAYGFTSSADRPPATTAARVREQENYDALLRLIRLLTVLQAARLAPDATYDTYDDAIAVRDALCEALDDQAEGSGDEAFTALGQLRADLVRAVPGEEGDLPHLMRHTPGYQLPSLVLTHRLYGDLSREADLLARNKIARPGFISGGIELEVLADA